MPTRDATWQKGKPRNREDLVGMSESDSVCFRTPDFATFIAGFRDRILSVRLQLDISFFQIQRQRAFGYRGNSYARNLRTTIPAIVLSKQLANLNPTLRTECVRCLPRLLMLCGNVGESGTKVDTHHLSSNGTRLKHCGGIKGKRLNIAYLGIRY